MHIETIALRIVDSHRSLCSKGTIGQLIVKAVISRQHITIDTVVHHHIIESLTISQFTIIEQTVTGHSLSLIGQYGTVQQLGLPGQSIINAPF